MVCWEQVIGLKELFRKYREQIAYLFFGGVTTVVNIVTYWLLARLGLSTGLANGIAWVLSVLVAYVTNRVWVFESKSRGLAAVKDRLLQIRESLIQRYSGICCILQSLSHAVQDCL